MSAAQQTFTDGLTTVRSADKPAARCTCSNVRFGEPFKNGGFWKVVWMQIRTVRNDCPIYRSSAD